MSEMSRYVEVGGRTRVKRVGTTSTVFGVGKTSSVVYGHIRRLVDLSVPPFKPSLFRVFPTLRVRLSLLGPRGIGVNV